MLVSQGCCEGEVGQHSKVPDVLVAYRAAAQTSSFLPRVPRTCASWITKHWAVVAGSSERTGLPTDLGGGHTDRKHII